MPCAPDATPPTIHGAGYRGATHTGLCRGSRSRAVSACRQDTRGEGVRQSVRASRSRPDASAHTARARDPGVYVVDVRGRRPASVPCRCDRGALAWCCGSTRGSRCWGLVLIPSPSSATIGPGSGPDSESHGLRHSCVDRVSLTWQHLSPSGLVVLHLELELKRPCLV